MSYSERLLDISKTQELLLCVNDEPVALPIRVPMAGEYVVIDAINYVCSVSAFDCFEVISIGANTAEVMSLELDDSQYQYMMDIILDKIQNQHLPYVFGDDFKLLPMIAGIHHYKHGFYIKNSLGETLGTVGIGGQNNTVFFGITGTGCKCADDGFENRLYEFLKQAPNARITRIDLAHDDLQGNYSSFDFANEQETELKFMLPKARNRPAVTIHGEYKHKDPLGKGLTLNVGSRKNGKVIRCYEKGKQLGDKESTWFRSELEMHNKSRFIPFEVLTKPTEFFCGAYPYCWELIDLAKKHKGDNTPQKADKMPVVERQAKISLNKAIAVIKHQFGKYIKAFADIFTKDGKPDYDLIFNKIMSDKTKDYYPARLKNVGYLLKKDKDGNNIEFLQQLKDDYRNKEIDVIVENSKTLLSAKQQQIRWIFNAGINGKLPKFVTDIDDNPFAIWDN